MERYLFMTKAILCVGSPTKKPPAVRPKSRKLVGKRYYASMRGNPHSFVSATLFDPAVESGVVDSHALRVRGITGSEIEILYTGNGSPILHEKFVYIDDDSN